MATQTSAAVAVNDVVKALDHYSLVTDTAVMFTSNADAAFLAAYMAIS